MTLKLLNYVEIEETLLGFLIFILDHTLSLMLGIEPWESQVRMIFQLNQTCVYLISVDNNAFCG